MFLHRVGEKRLQHSPSVVIPPHAPLSPACYPRYPFRNTVCAIDAIDGIDPDGVFIIFSPRAIFLSSIPTFFHFPRESMASMPSMAQHCVLNLNLTDGSKTKYGTKYGIRHSIYGTQYPASVSNRRSKRVQMVQWHRLCHRLCHRSGGKSVAAG